MGRVEVMVRGRIEGMVRARVVIVGASAGRSGLCGCLSGTLGWLVRVKHLSCSLGVVGSLH